MYAGLSEVFVEQDTNSEQLQLGTWGWLIRLIGPRYHNFVFTVLGYFVSPDTHRKERNTISPPLLLYCGFLGFQKQLT